MSARAQAMETALRDAVKRDSITCVPCAMARGIIRPAVSRYFVAGPPDASITVCRECLYREVASGKVDSVSPVFQPLHVQDAERALAVSES